MKKVSRHVRWFGLILVFPLGSLVQAQSNTLGAVAEVAYEQGLARKKRPKDLAAYIRKQMWEPEY